MGKLDSGLSFISETRLGTQVAACWLRIDVGCINELPEEWGAAHFLEHMLFKRNDEDVSQFFDALGADLNAYTTYEETVLHCVLPSKNLLTALEVMGRIMFSPIFEQKDVDMERGVILEEISESLGEPSRMLSDVLANEMWGDHPYSRHVLGSKESIEKMTFETIKNFHKKWYTLKNATLVVVGDFEEEEVLKVVKNFSGREGDVEKRETPSRKNKTSSSLHSVKTVFQERMLELAIQIPGHGHPDLPALDLFVSCLAEGDGAILNTKLHLEKNVVHTSWATIEESRDGGVLSIGFVPTENLDVAFSDMINLLREILKNGLPLDSIQRAKSAVLSDRIYNDETAEGRASTISWYDAYYGDYNYENTYRERITALSPTQILTAIRSHLNLDKAAVAVVGPDMDLKETFDELLNRPREIARQKDNRKIVYEQINGINVIVEKDELASLSSLYAVCRGGTLLETPKTAGHSKVWAGLLTRGTKDLDATRYAQTVDLLSGSIRGFSTLSTMGISATFPAQNFLLGLTFVFASLTEPAFNESDIRQYKAAMREVYRTRTDDPEDLVAEELDRLLFPKHPYSLLPSGNLTSIERISARGMNRLKRHVLSPNALTISVVGPVEADRIFREVERLKLDGEFSLPERKLDPIKKRFKLINGEWSSTVYSVGFRVPSALDKASYALEVLSTILGAPGGRLFNRLREQTGLSYDTHASYFSGLDSGSFSCSLSAVPERADEAIKQLDLLIEELQEQPPTETELIRAKASIEGINLMSFQRGSFRAAKIAIDECFGLNGKKYIENSAMTQNVTLQELHEVISEYLIPSNAVRVVARS